MAVRASPVFNSSYNPSSAFTWRAAWLLCFTTEILKNAISPLLCPTFQPPIQFSTYCSLTSDISMCWHCPDKSHQCPPVSKSPNLYVLHITVASAHYGLLNHSLNWIDKNPLWRLAQWIPDVLKFSNALFPYVLLRLLLLAWTILFYFIYPTYSCPSLFTLLNLRSHEFRSHLPPRAYLHSVSRTHEPSVWSSHMPSLILPRALSIPCLLKDPLDLHVGSYHHPQKQPPLKTL